MFMIIKNMKMMHLFKLEIRKKFRELINLGFQDTYRHFNKDKQGIYFLGLYGRCLAKK